MICPLEEKKTRGYPITGWTTQEDKKKKKGVAAFKDSEVAGKDGACFDAEVHSKAGEEKKNRRFLKNAPGTMFGMPQKGVQQLWPLHAIKITARVI